MLGTFWASRMELCHRLCVHVCVSGVGVGISQSPKAKSAALWRPVLPSQSEFRFLLFLAKTPDFSSCLPVCTGHLGKSTVCGYPEVPLFPALDPHNPELAHV